MEYSKAKSKATEIKPFLISSLSQWKTNRHMFAAPEFIIRIIQLLDVIFPSLLLVLKKIRRHLEEFLSLCYNQFIHHTITAIVLHCSSASSNSYEIRYQLEVIFFKFFEGLQILSWIVYFIIIRCNVL